MDNRPLFSLTVDEFQDLIKSTLQTQAPRAAGDSKKYVYGLQGIADLLGCSRQKAYELKKAGVLDGAVKQLGRLMITDAEKAMELYESKCNRHKV